MFVTTKAMHTLQTWQQKNVFKSKLWVQGDGSVGVKCMLLKPEDLSSVSRPHVGGAESQHKAVLWSPELSVQTACEGEVESQHKAVLWSPHLCQDMGMLVHAHVHTTHRW